MAVEVNITTPTSAQLVTFTGVNVVNVAGFCRSPGGGPTVDVWLINGTNSDKYHAASVNIVPVGGAPGFYQWNTSFTVPTGFSTTGNNFHCVKAILSTRPGGTSGDFITRTAEVFFQASGFSTARRGIVAKSGRSRKPSK
jgi:hypothetical protein